MSRLRIHVSRRCVTMEVGCSTLSAPSGATSHMSSISRTIPLALPITSHIPALRSFCDAPLSYDVVTPSDALTWDGP